MNKKKGFSTLNIKDETSYTIGLIAATENMKIYEVVEEAVKAKFPKYFENKKVATSAQ